MFLMMNYNYYKLYIFFIVLVFDMHDFSKLPSILKFKEKYGFKN